MLPHVYKIRPFLHAYFAYNLSLLNNYTNVLLSLSVTLFFDVLSQCINGLLLSHWTREDTKHFIMGNLNLSKIPLQFTDSFHQ